MHILIPYGKYKTYQWHKTKILVLTQKLHKTRMTKIQFINYIIFTNCLDNTIFDVMDIFDTIEVNWPLCQIDCFVIFDL